MGTRAPVDDDDFLPSQQFRDRLPSWFGHPEVCVGHRMFLEEVREFLWAARLLHLRVLGSPPTLILYVPMGGEVYGKLLIEFGAMSQYPIWKMGFYLLGSELRCETNELQTALFFIRRLPLE